MMSLELAFRVLSSRCRLPETSQRVVDRSDVGGSAVLLAGSEWKRGGKGAPSFHRRRKQLPPGRSCVFVGAEAVPQWLRVVALERRRKNDSGNCAKMEQE
jgi:hypothetical protein